MLEIAAELKRRFAWFDLRRPQRRWFQSLAAEVLDFVVQLEKQFADETALSPCFVRKRNPKKQ